MFSNRITISLGYFIFVRSNTNFHIYMCRTFSTAEDVLKGARHMVAMQIAHEPLVRTEVRQAFRERARLTCKPTKKGLKVNILFKELLV